MSPFLYRTLNPTTEELIRSYPTATGSEIEHAIDSSVRSFADWRRTAIDRRAELLAHAAGGLERRASELASLMALEMGKPIEEGEAEANKSALGCRYYADHAAGFLAAEPRPSDGSEAFVRYDALGPIVAIMPWNFPFWQFFRFAAPALMAGNTVLLKHAPCTPGCATAIADLMREAGFPDGVVQSLFLTNEQAAEVIADRRVRGVTLTGSSRAGSEVAATAGRYLKPMVMELGGSDPFIVFEDADVAEAARVGALSRCLNSGQSCIAAKRFLVHRSRFKAFTSLLVEAMQARPVGDPTEPGTLIGPLARQDLRDTLARQVSASMKAGARAICGGSIPDRRGFFYPPTVLLDVAYESPAAGEELFGPVATVLPFDDEDEAFHIANQTSYGLGASIWTEDLEQARRRVEQIDAGAVFVNGLVKSDPRLPFGGVKGSGFGRELAREGILEFVNVKTVWIMGR